MQTWKRNDDRKVELKLTAGVAVRLEAHFEQLAILENPAYVLGNLHSPKVLLPVAIAMGNMDDLSIDNDDDWKTLAEDLDGKKYESLRAAVEEEIVAFFQGETRSRLQELISLNQQEARNAITKLKQEISQETNELSDGSSSSGNGPELSAASGETAPLANSSTAAGDGTGNSGTTRPPSSPPSPATGKST